MIITLDKLLPGSNIKGIHTFEQISNGTELVKAKVAINDNWKEFLYKIFTCSDYFVEAAKSFENQILVDLGAGRQLDGYVFAEIVGAHSYVCIEARHMKSIYKKITDPAELNSNRLKELIMGFADYIGTIKKYNPLMIKKLKSGMQRYLEEGTGRIPAVLIEEDMLNALKRIPSNSVSILASGIDYCIHPEDDYAFEVEEEISRVLHTKGAYIGIFSRFEPAGLKKIEKFKDWTFQKYIKS
jgi:hypothetical protein